MARRSTTPPMRLLDTGELSAFRAHVFEEGVRLYRDLPWRRTRDPYAILVSEVMLQQTQVSRVMNRWGRWLGEFPTLDALAAAPLSRVLQAWQGLGYNRRAHALWLAARACVDVGGVLPRSYEALVALPGVGSATAAGVRAFAFDEPGVYLETNVRTVILHDLLPDEESVPDRVIVPLVEQTCDPKDPRRWYYAMLDYGTHLKATRPNPSRRSAAHVRQSKFEGSHRQKRAFVLRQLIAASDGGAFASADEIYGALAAAEASVGREAPDPFEVHAILIELQREGMAEQRDGLWSVGG